MPEAVHLGDLLRIWVRPGARLTPSPPDFQGPTRAHRTPPEPRRFPGRGPLSRDEPIPGRPALHKEKRTLPGAPASFSGFVCVTALGASRRPSPPLRVRGSGPDSLSIDTGATEAIAPPFRTAFAYPLGPTDPCSTAVHMEPFSTSAFKALV
ncbi:rRNA promoter binding [Labeo rohita]|uniref:rRNA promoter binding n=2 Tax=Labeonini TaxID=2743697 RepID=A0A498M2C8_LABRO|nr:rRNA promoter binding [Labeo rohita]RXN15055.1 rRNA promoter binding [Labeo rohita]